jgi:hypothetical protein
VVEIEVPESTPDTEQTNTIVFDVNEIIGKVRNFVDQVRSISNSGENTAVSVDGFNFSVGKIGKEYNLTLKLNLTLSVKQ